MCRLQTDTHQFLAEGGVGLGKQIVQVALGNGQANADFGHSRKAREHGRVVNGIELIMFPDGPDTVRLYGVTDPADIAWMAERLTPQPWKCMEQALRLTNEAALWAIPQYHIVCKSTIPGRDPGLLAKARAEGRLWVIDTGHDLMMTEPRQTADALLEIAAR